MFGSLGTKQADRLEKRRAVKERRRVKAQARRRARKERIASAKSLQVEPDDQEHKAIMLHSKRLREKLANQSETEYDEQDIVMCGALPKDSDEDGEGGDAKEGGSQDLVYKIS